MAFLDHIARCNNFDAAAFLPFTVAGRRVGAIQRGQAGTLAAFGTIFSIGPTEIALNPGFTTPETRIAALREVEAGLIGMGVVPKLRTERFPILVEWGEEPVASLDRGAVPYFGIRAFGVHVNGLSLVGDETRMWIATRARDKVTDGGKLDNVVAGGQPHGLSLIDNLVKEAKEEAGIPADLARRAIPAGQLHYAMAVEGGVRRDTLFVYDLELPPDFVPDNTDGEVESFALMKVGDVAARVRDTDDFKFNVPLVIIDWLLRHDQLPMTDAAERAKIVSGLRQPFPL